MNIKKLPKKLYLLACIASSIGPQIVSTVDNTNDNPVSHASDNSQNRLSEDIFSKLARQEQFQRLKTKYMYLGELIQAIKNTLHDSQSHKDQLNIKDTELIKRQFLLVQTENSYKKEIATLVKEIEYGNLTESEKESLTAKHMKQTEEKEAITKQSNKYEAESKKEQEKITAKRRYMCSYIDYLSKQYKALLPQLDVMNTQLFSSNEPEAIVLIENQKRELIMEEWLQNLHTKALSLFEASLQPLNERIKEIDMLIVESSALKEDSKKELEHLHIEKQSCENIDRYNALTEKIKIARLLMLEHLIQYNQYCFQHSTSCLEYYALLHQKHNLLAALFSSNH